MAAKLTTEAQMYVVQCLACGDAPTAIVRDVQQRFGIAITVQSVERYDPTKYAGRNLPTRWRAVFETTRETFHKAVADIPVAHRSYRLRLLERMIDRAEAIGALALGAQLLEQAAKEMGSWYTNRRRIEASAPGAVINVNQDGSSN